MNDVSEPGYYTVMINHVSRPNNTAGLYDTTVLYIFASDFVQILEELTINIKLLLAPNYILLLSFFLVILCPPLTWNPRDLPNIGM